MGKFLSSEMNVKADVKFQTQMPTMTELARQTGSKNFILLFDERLLQRLEFKIWAQAFENKFPLKAGEDLKRLDSWAKQVSQILPALRSFSRQESAIVAVGGGTIGDFAGFTASVLKRGIRYVNIPSTWLAAIDSAHGGKNGLNVDGFKNQVGTFYSAHKIYCVKQVLLGQPPANFESAMGEVLKIGLMEGKTIFANLNRGRCSREADLWPLLPKLIQAKMAVVRKDPSETKGYRELLNFGHTLGHVLELEFGLAHGLAVQKGLEFATELSRRQKILKPTEYLRVKNLLDKYPTKNLQAIPVKRLKLILSQDKKSIAGDQVKFVFIKRAGQLLIKKIHVSHLMSVAVELGWAR